MKARINNGGQKMSEKLYAIQIQETGTVTGNDIMKGFIVINKEGLELLDNNADQFFEEVREDPYRMTQLGSKHTSESGEYSYDLAKKLYDALNEYSSLAGTAFLTRPFYEELIEI